MTKHNPWTIPVIIAIIVVVSVVVYARNTKPVPPEIDPNLVMNNVYAILATDRRWERLHSESARIIAERERTRTCTIDVTRESFHFWASFGPNGSNLRIWVHPMRGEKRFSVTLRYDEAFRIKEIERIKAYEESDGPVDKQTEERFMSLANELASAIRSAATGPHVLR